MINEATHASTGTLPPPKVEQTAKPIAHWTHTLALLALLAFTTIYERNHAAKMIATVPHPMRYGSSIALEWVLLGLVIAGIHQRPEFLSRAFCNRSQSWAQSLGLGAMVYVMGTMALLAVGIALINTPLFKAHNQDVVLAMLPHSLREFALWFGVSLTAGVCEELIFRGYLLQQLTAWMRNQIAAILIAGLIFGSAHLYEGLGAVLPLAALAIVYGFAVRRLGGDLRAVIVAHTLQDFLVAFLALAKPWLERHAGQS